MIRLLIVDDSPLMRRLLTEIFAACDEFEITAVRSGEEALARLHEVRPDVVTLDIHMPGMDGLACLDQIMIERPCPVVMVSSLTAEGANETFEAMALGAVDFVAKPRGAVSLEMDALAAGLVEKVRVAASARISRTTRLRDRVRLRAQAGIGRSAPSPAPPPTTAAWPSARGGSADLIVVGSSTGGPPALELLLRALPADFPSPIVIAQHMPATFTGPLARRLDRLSALSINEVERTTPIEPGHVYIARGDADIIVSRRAGTLVAVTAPKSEAHMWHPSVERLVETAMRVVDPARLVGVLLTGMGSDGAEAMATLKERGGHTIAEAEESAVVWGMPGALAQRGGASQVVPIDQVARSLTAWLMP